MKLDSFKYMVVFSFDNNNNNIHNHHNNNNILIVIILILVILLVVLVVRVVLFITVIFGSFPKIGQKNLTKDKVRKIKKKWG